LISKGFEIASHNSNSIAEIFYEIFWRLSPAALLDELEEKSERKSKYDRAPEELKKIS
jgi:hypothetical protein